MTSPAPLRKNRPDWWVTPCRTCGEAGDNFDLRADPRKPYGLTRYCVPCNARGRARMYALSRLDPENVCAFEGCGRLRHGNYCFGHAKQLTVAKGDRSKLRPLKTYSKGELPCRSCGRETLPGDRARGLCRMCWMRRRRAGEAS